MAKYTTNELNKQAADIIEKPIRDEIIAMAKGKKGKSLEGGFSQEFVDGLVETYHKKSDLKDFGLSKELQEELKADHKLNLKETLDASLKRGLDHSNHKLTQKSGATTFMEDFSGLRFEFVPRRLGSHNVPNSINKINIAATTPKAERGESGEIGRITDAFVDEAREHGMEEQPARDMLSDLLDSHPSATTTPQIVFAAFDAAKDIETGELKVDEFYSAMNNIELQLQQKVETFVKSPLFDLVYENEMAQERGAAVRVDNQRRLTMLNMGTLDLSQMQDDLPPETFTSPPTRRGDETSKSDYHELMNGLKEEKKSEAATTFDLSQMQVLALDDSTPSAAKRSGEEKFSPQDFVEEFESKKTKEALKKDSPPGARQKIEKKVVGKHTEKALNSNGKSVHFDGPG